MRRRWRGGTASRRVSSEALQGWLEDGERTVYLLDIRTAEERASDPAERQEALARHGVVHAPGGQLVQATDQWIGVRHARLVVLDEEELRAPVTASWLCRQGHDAAVLQGGLAKLATLPPRPQAAVAPLPEPARIEPEELDARRRQGGVTILDLRASAAFRAGHVPGAVWAIRPRIAGLAGAEPRILVADAPEIAALAALDLSDAGQEIILLLDGGFEAWQAAGLPVEAAPDTLLEDERIDFVSFTHGRHEGSAAASRQYLEWEIGLVGQLDEQERAVFLV